MTNYTLVEVTGTSYNITGLQPFTNYMVTVQANNTPVVEFGPHLSEVFTTLPEASGVAPTVDVPTFGVGTSGVVDIVIPAPTFQDFLRYAPHRPSLVGKG